MLLGHETRNSANPGRTGAPRAEAGGVHALGTTGLTVGYLGVLLLALVFVLAHRANPRVSAHPSTIAALTVTPSILVDFVASSEVRSPVAVVARFSLTLLPLVAVVVTVSRMYELTVARIGGLYGP